MVAVLTLVSILLQPGTATIVCHVVAGGVPVADADVVVGGATYKSDNNGAARLQVTAGSITLVVRKEDFLSATTVVEIDAGETRDVTVTLERQPRLEERVTVSATRTDKRIADEPTRVEVLDAEDLEEEQAQTPGDVIAVLTEKAGIHVQTTSPGLGTATIRIQGMRGRYTRLLSDGLPLFGDDLAGLALLQVPPADLGRVELIKGVASALYGAGALGGVIDLISRRPAGSATRELLLNRSSRGATDAVFFAAQPLTAQWSGTLLAGGNFAERADVDDDGWADVAGYSRGVLRPRLFWDNGRGSTLFASVGATWERRRGGTMPGAALEQTGAPFAERLDTARLDGGFVAQTLVGGRYVLTARGSFSRQRLERDFGGATGADRSGAVFGEVALRGTAPHQTWVVGTAFDRSTLEPREAPRLAYAYNVPGAFAEDDVDLARWVSVSASGRVDVHDAFGTFVSPRFSVLLKDGGWSARASAGTGFVAPSPLTDETQTAGLAGLRVPQPLRAEHGRSMSVDLTKSAGPISVTASLFASAVRNPIVLDRDRNLLANLGEPTQNSGVEMFVACGEEPVTVTATYTYVRSAEGVGSDRAATPLTPRHHVGLVAAWDEEHWGRVVLESFYTGRQRLDGNPFRTVSAPFVVFGIVVERRLARMNLFVNAENLANVKQTDWDPLLRRTPAADGEWTVDAWAPLDGRVVNGGIRIRF